MMKKLLFMTIPWASTVFCGEAKKLQGVAEVSHYLGERIILNTELAALYNKNLKKGMQADFEIKLGVDSLLLTSEENTAVRKGATKRLEELEETFAQQFELEKIFKDEIVQNKAEFDEYKDKWFIFFDRMGVGAIKATTHSVLGGAYSYPKWFANNVIQNKGARLATRAVLAPLGFLQGFGADCYVKCLSVDDNHRAVAWSKVVAWTGDGF